MYSIREISNIKKYKLSEFLILTDLFDRNLENIILEDGETTLRFDLYHCDDQYRSANGTEYLIDIVFPANDISIIQDAEYALSEPFIGEVLSSSAERDYLKILVECRSINASGVSMLEISADVKNASVIEHSPRPIKNPSA